MKTNLYGNEAVQVLRQRVFEIEANFRTRVWKGHCACVKIMKKELLQMSTRSAQPFVIILMSFINLFIDKMWQIRLSVEEEVLEIFHKDYFGSY